MSKTKVLTGKRMAVKLANEVREFLNPSKLDRMLIEIPYKMLFKIKCVNSRKGGSKKNQYNLIRLRDGKILKKNVNGRGKLENFIKREYKEEFKAYNEYVERMLLGHTN